MVINIRRSPAHDELSVAEKQRALWALLASTFLTWAGFFVVMPLIAVHYVDQLGWAASSVGLVLAVRQFTQQGSSTFSGALADRLGAKGLICAGLYTRVIGFGLMAWADRYWILMLSAIITALGGGIFESPKAAAVATLTDETNRRRYYSMMGVVAGLGTALGTLAGALLIRVDFARVSLAGAVVFLIAATLMLVFLPSIEVATERHGLFQGIAYAMRDRIFMKYALLLMGYWFIATQFNLPLTLRATSVMGTESAAAWIFGIQAGVTIVLGYPLPRIIERRISAFPMLVLGIGLIAVGMGAVAGAVNIPLLFTCVFLISFGTILARPGEQMVCAGMADPAARGSYFGVAALSLAIGGGFGTYAGGVIYDAGLDADRPEIPWIVFAAVGLIAVAGLWRIRHDVLEASRQRNPTPVRQVPTPTNPKPVASTT